MELDFTSLESALIMLGQRLKYSNQHYQVVAIGIGKHWVNERPTSFLESGLPEGFEQRLVTHGYDGLTIHFASRFDQICFKLYAAIDQGPDSKHFADLTRLQPTREELLTAKKWCYTQDVSQEFSIMMEEALSALGFENG